MKPKPTTHAPLSPSGGQSSKGFALVITLSLMILLTVIAVGLLTLSSVALRSTSRNESMATARANARLALMLALGDMQKYAGPDQRITARADIVDEKIANPRLTGIWKSWKIDAKNPPSAADYEKTRKNQEFLGWLVSSGTPNAAADINHAKTDLATQPIDKQVTLWGGGTLGSTPALKQEDIVRAAKVVISSNSGAMAWAVMDEGIKVRINSPNRSAASSDAAKTAQLGTGIRPNAGSIPTLSGLKRSMFEKDSPAWQTLEKGITADNFSLAAGLLVPGTDALLKPLTHDVTTHSAGLFTNVAEGGLKEDFHLLGNRSVLPSKYAKQGVYHSTLDVTGPSDPPWAVLHDFARIYQDSARLARKDGVPVLNARIPANWKAANGSNADTGVAGTVNPVAPPGVVLMPTVAKVQLIFTLLTRDIYRYSGKDGVPKTPGTEEAEKKAELHGPWGVNFAGSSYDYLLHLQYTPVVTLHNPYNVAIEFTQLKLVFGNVPFGLKVYRNGLPQTKGFAPLDTMFYMDAETGKKHKRFGMRLNARGGSAANPTVGSTTIRLQPGEVMMFSPYINPNRTWADEYTSGSRVFQDWDNAPDRTLTIDGIPGWRGDGIGFDLDWFCPTYNGLRDRDSETENSRNMWRGGCIGARAQDQFYVEFAPLSVPDLSKNKFTVEIFARTSSSSAQVSSSVIEMDYESPTGLQDSLLGTNGFIRFPKNGTISTMAMHSHSTTPIRNIVTAKPFVVVSAQAKTTMGGAVADGEDGRLATKPWSFGHPVVGAVQQKMVSQHPANHAHEFAMERLDSGTNNLLQFDPNTGRGNFITGLTGNTGRKFGALYDIPLGPLQSLAGLNGANPGGCTIAPPRFAQPIGNSWAHPMLSAASLKDGSLLDHSFLLNLALYDRFYFSGLADQTGLFGSGVKSPQLVSDFSAGKPLADPRMIFRNAGGRPSEEFIALAAKDDAYASVAAWEMMNGTFNINSTSVNAWKAVLASVHDPAAIYNMLATVNGKPGTKLATLSPVDEASQEARISRFRLPASQSARKDPSANERNAYWLGPREYNDAELTGLATRIVEQVRQRGPFLSMAEFVNRQLGSGEKAQRGALQQAIDNSDINRNAANAANAGYEITQDKVAKYGYNNTDAGTGPSYQGAPGYLSQADLLSVLGNAATPRSDTFTIRGYGEARDASNRVIASATCEAVVQRVPEYVDATDSAETAPADLKPANQRFGRRFQIISFRWLTQNEI